MAHLRVVIPRRYAALGGLMGASQGLALLVTWLAYRRSQLFSGVRTTKRPAEWAA